MILSRKTPRAVAPPLSPANRSTHGGMYLEIPGWRPSSLRQILPLAAPGGTPPAPPRAAAAAGGPPPAPRRPGGAAAALPRAPEAPAAAPAAPAPCSPPPAASVDPTAPPSTAP